MNRQTRAASGARRATKACARCRKRKIKCDFNFPTCGTCAQAGADCLGYDVVKGLETPRSTVSHLESQIAELEIDLARLKSDRTVNALGSANVAVGKLTSRLARAIGEPWISNTLSNSDMNVLSLASPTFLSQSPLPRFKGTLTDQPQPLIPGSAGNSTLSSIPRHVIDIMLKNYCQIYLPQYPAVDEASIYESCEKIYSNSDPSPFDVFSVSITLAISATTLIRYDEKRAMACAVDFWNTAAEQLPYVGCGDTWQRVQCLQLLTHYGLLNPKTINCCNCASAATRLVLQLGLHRELPALNRTKLDSTLLNTRRRLFWTSYSIDAALHSVLCRPFIWPNGAINAEFPEPGPGAEISPAARGWSIRQIEAEITTTMYFPSIPNGVTGHIPPESFQKWSQSMEHRLESLSKSPNNGLADSIDLQIFRLNRPSPRCPKPTSEMRRKAIIAAISLTTEYVHMERSGSLFYIWYAAHYLTELGASLLDCIIAGLEEPRSGYTPSYLDEFDITLLMRTIRTFPLLLSKVASRWPEISQQASTLEEIALPVLQDLESRSRGNIMVVTDYSLSKQKLSQFLLSSETFAHDAGGLRNGIPESPFQASFTAGTPQQVPTAFSPFDTAWSQSGMGGFDIDGNAFWDSGGLNSDQIFAALLRGKDIDVLPT